ncbi:MAG: TetR/AcrR family transcriptional regulator [Bacteroidia bacterium]|nr:TetR/AcrR family transcriptional regulator [Bacteroidia bacterium]
METTKKSKKKGAGALDEKIKSSYQEFVLVNGHQPASVYKFCLDLEIKEDEFYNHFGSFEALERQIWKAYVDDTVKRLHDDAAFASFSAREKILAFYYTLLEVLKSSRSFILLQLQGQRRPEFVPDFLKGFKSSFEAFVSTVLNEGKTKNEIAKRPMLDDRYPSLFWIHASLLLFFWKEDESAGFEKTDAFVEKSVNLAFDLIGKGAVDSAIDFAKFMYQSKMK